MSNLAGCYNLRDVEDCKDTRLRYTKAGGWIARLWAPRKAIGTAGYVWTGQSSRPRSFVGMDLPRLAENFD
jgi:hypothetical protein